jgi:hypothetical protein
MQASAVQVHANMLSQQSNTRSAEVRPAWSRWLKGVEHLHSGLLEILHVAGDHGHAVYPRGRGPRPMAGVHETLAVTLIVSQGRSG